MYVKARPVPVATDMWSGPYIGAYLGWQQTKDRSDIDSNAGYALPNPGWTSAGSVAFGRTNPLTGQTNTWDPATGAGGGGVDGITGGVFLGYNFRPAGSRLVFGFEGDVGAASGGGGGGTTRTGTIAGTYLNPNNTNGACDVTCGGDTFDANGTQSLTIGRPLLAWDMSLRLRAGFLATENLLVYGTGGLAIAGVRPRNNYAATVTFRSDAGANPADPFTDDATDANGGPYTQAIHTITGATNATVVRTGWTLGAGGELKLSRNWSMRGEYRYTDLGTVTSQMALAGTTTDARLPVNAGGTLTVRQRIVAQGVRFGIAYAFNP